MSIETGANEGSNSPGRLIVVSGPSGSGKTTIVRRVVTRPDVNASLSVSATTRPPRRIEQDGSDYFFYSRGEFERGRAAGEFLESAEVHGNLYGTPAGPVLATLAGGQCVILEIDVQGGRQVIEKFPETMLVFVNTPTFAELEERLRGRFTDDESTIQRRLANARREIELGRSYHHQIINGELSQAVDDLADLLTRLGCGGPVSDA